MHKHAYHSLKEKGERLPKVIITSNIYMPDSPTPPTHSRLTTTYVSSSHQATSTPSCTPPVPSLSRPSFSHSVALSLILCHTLEREGEVPLNTTSFLCYQINHITNKHLALIAFLLCPTESCRRHQSLSSSPTSGSRTSLPVINPNQCQICLVNTHPSRRCSMVSSSWLHSGHESW